MIKSEDLQLLSYLRRYGSIAAAARQIHLTPSAVSQRLTLLEEKLNSQLAIRNGRSGIVLTDQGQFIVDRADKILSELKFLQVELDDRRNVVSGNISIAASLGFGQRQLAPLLATFGQHYPDVRVNLKLSDDPEGLPKSDWDILITVAAKHKSSLIRTELAKNQRLICASPNYLEEHGMPQNPDELANHKCIIISEDGLKGSQWKFVSKKGRAKKVSIKPQYITNDGESALSWALAGLGILVRSEWSAKAYIKSGQLVEIMKGWTLADAPIAAFISHQKSQSVLVQRVLKYIKAEIS